MRVAEAAKRLGISERSVYRMVENKVLPAAIQIRDSPLVGYDISEHIINEVLKKLKRLGVRATPTAVRAVLLAP